MLLAGAAGTIVSGLLSDLIDRRMVVAGLLFASAPLLYMFSSMGSVPFASIMLIAALGFVLTSAHPVIVVISHELLPESKGIASSLVHGVTFGVASLLIPLVGLGIDLFGFLAVFYMMAAMLPIGGALMLLGVRHTPSIR